MEDIKMVLGERVKKARERMGFSQKAVADKMGFPAHQIVSQIENGIRDIKAWEISKLANILKVDISELLSIEPPQNKGIILWRDLPDKGRDEIERNFQRRCQEYYQIEKAASVNQAPNLPSFPIDVSTLNFNNVNEMSAEITRILDLGSKPALSLEKVLEDQYGVKIWYEDLGETGSAASTWDEFGPAILMNSRQAPWRRNYNFAHELFHLITWKSIPPESFMDNKVLFKKIETLANVFASSLLLPAESVIHEVEKYVSNDAISFNHLHLVSIARDFDVSTEALLYRLMNLKRITMKTLENLLVDKEFISIDTSTMHKIWKYRNPPQIPERFVKLGFIAYQKGNITRARLAEYLNTSLFELKGMFLDYGYREDEDYEAKISTV